MAHMPVEIVEIGRVSTDAMTQAITTANALQDEFVFLRLDNQEAALFRMHKYDDIVAPKLFAQMKSLRRRIKGFHPFMIAFVDGLLIGKKHANLFAANESQHGLGVVTTFDAIDKIIPREKSAAYFMYYLAHQTLGFIAPQHQNHVDTRGCVFDFKGAKGDLIKSMRSDALCDECRRALLRVNRLSPAQLNALDKLYGAAGTILRGATAKARRPRVFIGSSSEGLHVANKISQLLEADFAVEVWNRGNTFGLGTATLESLEQAVERYDFAIFVFTPDDKLHTRGRLKPVARDNVVFELGLFIGKLSRRKAFVLQPTNINIALQSDLAGIATASYDQRRVDRPTAFNRACRDIRNAISAVAHRA
jgi:predicted nucleotide-binding protein